MAPSTNGHNGHEAEYVVDGEIIGQGTQPVHIPYHRTTPIPKPHLEKRQRNVLEMLGMKKKSLEADHEERLFKQYLVGRELAFRREVGTALGSKNLQTVGQAACGDQQFVTSLPYNSYAQQVCADIVADMGARRRLELAKDAELFETITDNLTLQGR